jgi:hypothetical protein
VIHGATTIKIVVPGTGRTSAARVIGRSPLTAPHASQRLEGE